MSELNRKDRELLEELVAKIDRWHLTVPAILFLEMNKPISFVGSQLLIVISPFMHIFFKEEQYNRFVRLMAERDNVEILITMIEAKAKEGNNGKRN